MSNLKKLIWFVGVWRFCCQFNSHRNIKKFYGNAKLQQNREPHTQIYSNVEPFWCCMWKCWHFMWIHQRPKVHESITQLKINRWREVYTFRNSLDLSDCLLNFNSISKSNFEKKSVFRSSYKMTRVLDENLHCHWHVINKPVCCIPLNVSFNPPSPPFVNGHGRGEAYIRYF